MCLLGGEIQYNIIRLKKAKKTRKIINLKQNTRCERMEGSSRSQIRLPYRLFRRLRGT